MTDHPILWSVILFVALHFAAFRERAFAVFGGYICLVVAFMGYAMVPVLPHPDDFFLFFLGSSMVVTAGVCFISAFRR